MRLLFLACITFFAVNVSAQENSKTEKKEYLGILTLAEKYKDEKNWTEKDLAIGNDHYQRLLKMRDDGIVVLAGRTQYEMNDKELIGLVIFYAEDDKAAEKFMQDDPTVKNKIMLAKVHLFGIAVKCE